MYYAILITEDAKPGVMYAANSLEEAAQLGAKIIDDYVPYIVDPDVGEPAMVLADEFGYVNPSYVEAVYVVQTEN